MNRDSQLRLTHTHTHSVAILAQGPYNHRQASGQAAGVGVALSCAAAAVFQGVCGRGAMGGSGLEVQAASAEVRVNAFEEPH